MKMVNAALLAVFLATAGCSGETVPNKDAVEASLNAGDLSKARFLIGLALKAHPADSDLHFLNGKIAFEVGNFDLAKSEFGKLQGNPKFGKQARVWLARAQLGGGNARLALSTLESVPLDTGLAYSVAVDAAMIAGKPDQAKAELAKGLSAFPQSIDLLLVDAQIAMTEQDMPRARADSAKITAEAPKNVHGLLLAARVALIDEHKADAEKAFDAVLELDKDNQVALLGKAALAHDRKDSKAANEFLVRAAKASNGGSLQTRAFMAQMALEAGDAVTANRIMESLPADLNMPYVVMLRGVIAHARGQNEQAISLLQPFLNNGGESAAARYALSDAFSATGDNRKAWTYLKPLADAANASPQVLELAAKLTAALNMPESSGYSARRQAALQPDPIAADMKQADQAIAAGDWSGADAIYQRLAAQPANASNVILFNNAANARLRLGDLGQAVALARKAAALAPNDPFVADTLGWSLFKQAGATPEVVELMRKAYAAQPGNPEIRDHLTQISRTLKPIN